MGKDMVDGEWKDFPDNNGQRPMFKLDGQVPQGRRSGAFHLGHSMAREMSQQIYDHEFKNIVGLDGQDYV